MRELQNFLARYKNLTPPEGSKKKVLIETLYRECGVSFKEKDLTFRGGGVTLSCHPITRSEVIQCAPRVLEVLYKEHGIHIAFIR